MQSKTAYGDPGNLEGRFNGLQRPVKKSYDTLNAFQECWNHKSKWKPFQDTGSVHESLGMGVLPVLNGNS